MSRFFDPSSPLLHARDLVLTFTGRRPEELALPERVIITFSDRDLHYLVHHSRGTLLRPWARMRQIYSLEDSPAVATRSYFGGPNIAALVEELSSFGAREFVMWGYCGSIDAGLAIGDILIPPKALREDGVSYHYSISSDPFADSDWFGEWAPLAASKDFHVAPVWSCDAIYRETAGKVERFREMGIKAVEMEAASLYSVCSFKKVRGIALLVVSDLLTSGRWQGGFHLKSFKEGARRLSQFVADYALSPSSGRT